MTNINQVFMKHINHPTSLAFYKFEKTIEEEIRTYWAIISMAHFSSIYLTSQPKEKYIDEIGGKYEPFTYISIPIAEFLKTQDIYLNNIRENTLVNIITAFEVYLNDIYTRMIYLNPSIIEKSEISLTAQQIAPHLISKDTRLWFAKEVTKQRIRNKKHDEMIRIIAQGALCDIKSIRDKLDQWMKFTYIRNSIVHVGRRVSEDLQKVWSQRFICGQKLNIQNKDIMYAATTALTIAKHLEPRINETCIKDNDAKLLIREVFIREGYSNQTIYKQIIQKVLSYCEIPENFIGKVITAQKNDNGATCEEFDFDTIYRFIIQE